MKLKINSDKSLSHRAILASVLSCSRPYKIRGLTLSLDIKRSLDAVQNLGVKVSQTGDEMILHPGKLTSSEIDCGNSGTTMRLLLGLLAGRRVSASFLGDQSLKFRPMDRVILPLQMMGAEIDDNYPFYLKGRELRGIDYTLPIASAQVKSALLFAALSARGETVLRGKLKSRNHTENLIRFWGGKVEEEETLRISGEQKLVPKDLDIPRDLSSACFWISLGILQKQEVILENVLLNPTRLGFLKILKKMGVPISWKKDGREWEESGTIILDGGSYELSPFRVDESEISSLIDEIPLLCILAGLVKGDSYICAVDELKVKESNRVLAIEKLLGGLGVKYSFTGRDFMIQGQGKVSNGDFFYLCSTSLDHRIIMALGILEVFFQRKFEGLNRSMVSISYPEFWEERKKFIL